MGERVTEHNYEIVHSAEYRAWEMRQYPSALEEKMEEFLRDNGIKYESQKIFYIYAEDGWIIRYFIADFYIPDKKLIIEVDGKKYHEHHSQKDKERTRIIQEHYPFVEVIRYTWEDMKDEYKMDNLLKGLRFSDKDCFC